MKNRLLAMVGLFVVVVLANAVSAVAQGPMRPVEVPKDPEYTRLLDKLKNGDTGVDYKALRLAFARSGAPGVRGVDPKIRLKLAEAVKAKKYEEIAKTAQEILKIHFLDLNIHAVAAAAYEALKDTKKYNYHQAIYLGLINSIVNGADGESAKTAYIVVVPDEINAVLKAYELQRTANEMLTEGTSRYEVVTVTDKANGAVSKVYFNIDFMPKPPETAAKP